MPVMPMHSVPARIFLTTELGLQGCVQDVFDPLLAVRGPTVDVGERLVVDGQHATLEGEVVTHVAVGPIAEDDLLDAFSKGFSAHVIDADLLQSCNERFEVHLGPGGLIVPKRASIA